jgi:hypothetical protein
LESSIGITAIRWWRRGVLLVALTIIMSIVSAIFVVVITAIIAAVSVVVATVRSSVTIVVPIRLAIAVIVVTVVVVAVVVAAVATVAALSFLGLWRDAKGVLQLFTLRHGVLRVTVELTCVVQHAIEVTFKQGRSSQRVGHVDYTRSLARPNGGVGRQGNRRVIYFVAFGVMDNCILSIDELVDIGQEVSYGSRAGLMDLLEELEVGDTLIVVGDDVFVLHTCKLVVVFEEVVSVVL